MTTLIFEPLYYAPGYFKIVIRILPDYLFVTS